MFILPDFLLILTYFSFLWGTTIYENYTMDTLTYLLFAGLTLLLVFLVILHERRKYQRFARSMDMDVKVAFQKIDNLHDHICRGSVMLSLRGCEENIKAIVIKHIGFSDSAFYVPVLDKLYFNGKGGDTQLLSARFRIQLRSLQQLEGKRIGIHLSGWISDNEGNTKPFKGHISYTVNAFSNDAPSDNASAAGMTALTS